MIFYRATGGGSAWTGSNWGRDQPIGTWEGVNTNAEGRVTHLQLYDRDLTGTLPAELGQLTNLEWLNLGSKPIKWYASCCVRPTDQTDSAVAG